jgi:hypothetical protein
MPQVNSTCLAEVLSHGRAEGWLGLVDSVIPWTSREDYHARAEHPKSSRVRARVNAGT